MRCLQANDQQQSHDEKTQYLRKMSKNPQKSVDSISEICLEWGMEHETYTLKGILTAMRMIDNTRDKLSYETVENQTHVLVEIQFLHELLNDIEDAMTGNLEFEDE